jgi:hypothetical protein
MKNKYLKLPDLEVLNELFELDKESPSGLCWKNPSKYSKMKPGDTAGRKTHEGYWRVKINYIAYSVHRIIYYMTTGTEPGEKMIDHIEQRSDNFKTRLATNAQNQANKKKISGCSSKYKGVSYYPQHNKFKVGIMVDGNTIHLGYFINEIEAAKAYNEAAAKYFGEYALLNTIEA